MAAIRPYSLPILLLVTVAGSLLNTHWFDVPSFAAFFGFAIPALVTSILIFGRSIAHPVPRPWPLYLILFLVLSGLIFLQGLLTQTINPTHYYWAISGLWFLALHDWRADPKQRSFLFNGIAVLALLESFLVGLQLISVLPSGNIFFRCTGSWDNPNVTAMFLSMSLYAVLASRMRGLMVGVVLLAIVLLQCRTAYIVALVMLAGYYRNPLMSFLQRVTGLGRRGLGVGVVVGVLVFSFAISRYFKQASANARLSIWENSLVLIGQHPLAGSGFGVFERNYNLFAAHEALAVNDHVNMAYNDWLELGVQGGLLAVLLWLAFLVSMLWYYFRKPFSMLLPLAGFCVIQLTNFGFQAIPVFVFFLLYSGVNGDDRPSRRVAMWGPLLAIVVAGVLLFEQITIARALYLERRRTSVAVYQRFEGELGHIPIYRQHYGDKYLAGKQFRLALAQYLAGLEYSCQPVLLERAGYCYRELKVYDSSLYYYRILQQLQPHRLQPHADLLRLYAEMGDSAKMRQEAIVIRDMPVKIDSQGADSLKSAARAVLSR